MRIVFLGTPEFALPILETCARVGQLVGVIVQPDRPVGRSGNPQAPPAKQWALERGLPVEQPEKVKQGRLAAALSRYTPDVAVVAAYGRILPADALAVPRHGCLNVHASLLPELRGAAPAQWAVARGYARNGATILQMDEGLDTGDTLLQRSCKAAAGQTGQLLFRLPGRTPSPPWRPPGRLNGPPGAGTGARSAVFLLHADRPPLRRQPGAAGRHRGARARAGLHSARHRRRRPHRHRHHREQGA